MICVALVLSGSEVAAVLRADDLDPQIARYAFDESQGAFANARVALGSFAVCCGWIIASTRFLPRWVGWLAIASGAGLVLSRISWTNQIWLLPYLVFWLWVLIVSVLLLRRSFRGIALIRLNREATAPHIWREMSEAVVIEARRLRGALQDAGYEDISNGTPDHRHR